MSNIVSANTLFHFTKSMEHIVDILHNGFHPKCCLENLDFIYNPESENSSSLKIAIPMVCFCDIPLSQISTHKKKYGGYAIGLSKEWGERKGINPVLYELPHSNAIDIIKEFLKNRLLHPLEQNNKKSESPDSINEISSELLFLMCYLKPYEGKMWDGQGFNGEKIRFYDEREWRYIPSYNRIREKSLKPYMFFDDFLDTKKRDAFNRSLENEFRLLFNPEDIKYIIVDNEKDVLCMVRKIETLGKNYSDTDKKLLATKIISLQRIQEDF